jgi:uncharacterized protein with von Willebrand factor type A (vWA) domain
MTSRLRAASDVTGRLELDRHCVFRDAYDEAAFSRLCDENPRLSACGLYGETKLRSFPALLLDLFCLFFKLRPTLVDRSLVRPAFQVNRHLIARLAKESHVKRRRVGTALCEEAAGAATVSVAERLLRELAATDLAEENRLFELEESIDAGGRERARPAAVRRRSAAGTRPGGSGEAGGAVGRPLAYDLQQRLEMAEALENFRSFERLLALTRVLESRLANEDPTGSQPTEVYDIGLGDELSRLLPGELVALRAAPRKKDFLRRLLDRRLLTYEIAGRDRGGSMVVLVDVSHSMTGEKELVSKALAIALAEVAAGRGQPVSAILFGHRAAPPWRVDFRCRRPQKRQIADLAGTFFGGGTDFERPVSTALELVAARREDGGQIVLISDGLCEVGERWVSGVVAVKARRQIRIHSVIVDIGACSVEAAASFSDGIVRWSELTAPSGSGGVHFVPEEGVANETGGPRR